MERGRAEAGSLVIPKGAKNVYWAQKMLAEMSVPQQQAVYATELGYISGLSLKIAELRQRRGEAYARRSMSTSSSGSKTKWYAENGNKAVELWNAWMLKKA